MTPIERLRTIAEGHGARLGVTDLSPFPGVAREIDDRKRQGFDGGLGFTFTTGAEPSEPARSFPWAQSVVVVAVPYLTDGDGGASARAVARFADGDRYATVRAVLDEIAAELDANGHRTEKVFDDDRIVDRAVAVRAGVAWWGKSTMALTPGLGPWFLIGSVVTDLPLEPTAPMVRSCGTCDACIPACPTGAIVAPGVLDARRCLAAIFQSRGSIPVELRGAAGARVYGCDDCLVACPPGDQALARVATGSGGWEAMQVLEMSDREIEAAFAHWFIPGRRARFIRRNALVALGNTAPDGAIGVLAGYAGHPDALLREHARWALGAIGSVDAATVAALAEGTTDSGGADGPMVADTDVPR